MRVIFWLSMLILIGWSSTIRPVSCSQTDDQADEIFNRLQSLVTEYYPEATCEKKVGSICFKFNTRMFMIHHPLKTGEWQEARAQEGPNRGGILCNVGRAEGRYAGAAMVPQTFDCHYFKRLLMAPYCKRSNSHLIAFLDFPDNAKAEFLVRYRQLINSYAEEE